MTVRINPYGAFNFLVRLGEAGGENDVAGGFSSAEGFVSEIRFAEYRNGNDRENHVRKIPTLNTTGDVTLRRGLIGDPRLFEWLKTVREGNPDRRTVTVTLLDGDRSEVCQRVLQGALPKRWTGPALSATDGEVAIEELKLVAERIDFQSL